jgi:RNA 2',3'-cyclic 3'-phosphodiesterase
MRLFIALDLSEGNKDILEHFVIRLKKAGASGNFSRRNNLHITLAFIGETDRTAAVVQAMEATVSEPFTFCLSSLGVFRSNDSDTLYLNVENDNKMKTLAQNLADKLKKEGFQLENRSFKAHLTLGREICGWQQIHELPIPALEITAFEMTLFKSERIKGILTYTSLYAKKL